MAETTGVHWSVKPARLAQLDLTMLIAQQLAIGVDTQAPYFRQIDSLRLT